MSNSTSWGEIYFVIAMMLFSLLVTGIATYFFVRQYRREKAERELKKKEKNEYAEK